MSKFQMMEFIVEVGLEKREYAMLYDSHVMSEEDAKNECHFFNGGYADKKNLGHFIILDCIDKEFIRELIRDEKDHAYDLGYEHGQTNMLEAGYVLPTEEDAI